MTSNPQRSASSTFHHANRIRSGLCLDWLRDPYSPVAIIGFRPGAARRLHLRPIPHRLWCSAQRANAGQLRAQPMRQFDRNLIISKAVPQTGSTESSSARRFG
jgi:hypothetical protein